MNKQFSWLSCLNNPYVGNTLYMFDVITGSNETIMQTDPHTLLSPLLVSDTLKEIIAIDNRNNYLVRIGQNTSTKISDNDIGGIPANDGLVMFDTINTNNDVNNNGPIVYTTVVDGMKSKLTIIDHLTSDDGRTTRTTTIGTVHTIDVEWTLNYIHFVEGV